MVLSSMVVAVMQVRDVGMRVPHRLVHVLVGVGLRALITPVRVLVMLGAFIRNQDYRLVIVAAVVLMTILAGLVIGLSFSNPLAH